MAHLKKCPHCKRFHRLQRAYNKCKAKYSKESWPR